MASDLLDSVVISKAEEECVPSTSAPQFSDLFVVESAEGNLVATKDETSGNSSISNPATAAATDDSINLQKTEDTDVNTLQNGPVTKKDPEFGQTDDMKERQDPVIDNQVNVQISSHIITASQTVSNGYTETVTVKETWQSTSSSSNTDPEPIQGESDATNFLSLLNDRKHEEADDEFDFDMPIVQKPSESKPFQPEPQAPSEKPVPASHSQHNESTDTAPSVSGSEVEAKHVRSLDPQKQDSNAVEGIPPQAPSVVNSDVSQMKASQPESAVLPSASLTAETSQAIDEWENVQTITPGLQDENSQSAGPAVPVSPLVTYEELYQHACQANLDQFKDQILPNINRTGFKALKHALFGPPKLHKDLQGDRDQAFCLAQYAFDHQDKVHAQTLQTIYKKLTGAKFDCPRHGSHWEQIGFQGNDPSTDLRGCGMLGLIQLLHAVTTPQYLPLTREIYTLSLHDLQNFPFCIAGINMTRMVIQTLREDCLNKECNKRRGQSEPVLSVLNQMYMAAFYEFYTVWKTQHKTIADTGFVFKDLEQRMKKHPNVLLVQLEQRLKQQSGHASSSGAQVPSEISPISFTKME